MKEQFEVENPDFILSPHTGMTKQHYIELARYLLERAFTHVRSMDDPLYLPHRPGQDLPAGGITRLAVPVAGVRGT